MDNTSYDNQFLFEAIATTHVNRKKKTDDIVHLRTISFEDEINIGRVNENVVYDLMQDGNVFGRLAENIVCEYCTEFEMATDNQTYYDVVSSNDNSKWEVRTFTSRGCNLIPSYQIGSGRSYDQDEFHEKLNNIDGYIIVDNREFPIVKIYQIESWTAYNLFPATINSTRAAKITEYKWKQHWSV